MAFNLKGLFSKLKPAAKAAANYGDDAAKALTTYGDDVARGAIDYVDDFGIKYNTMQDLDNIGAALPANVESDFLDAVWDDPGPSVRKQNLVDDDFGPDWFDDDFLDLDTVATPAVEFDADTTAEILRRAELRRESDYWKHVAQDAEDDLIYLDRDSLWNTFYGQDPYTPEMRQKSHNLFTKMRLANERADRLMPTATRTTQDILGLPGNVDVPKLPTKELVRMHSHGGYRPHKNTALGRWFQQNAPQFNLWDVVDE